MYGIQVDLIVPDKYITYGSGTSTTYILPMFDQDYTIEYSYSDIAYLDESATGQKFPEYSIAKNLVLISRHNLTWSGLLEAEKDTFENAVKSFNNSFQPFTMRIWDTGVSYTDYYMIIEPDTLTLTKDKFDLWSVSITCIQLESL